MNAWIISLALIFSIHASVYAENNKNSLRFYSKKEIQIKKTEYKNALSYFKTDNKTKNTSSETKLFSPKRIIFTPNNDGKNDIAKIIFTFGKKHDQGIVGTGDIPNLDLKIDPSKIEFLIFNLNGYIVYSATDPKIENVKNNIIIYSFEWNGTTNLNNSKIADMGVYIFAIKANGSISKDLRGTITLVTDKNTLSN